MNIWKTCVLCVLFGLFGASPVLAESIVGAWTNSGVDTTAEGASVVVFLDNGYYFQIQNAKAADAPHAVDGFERGTYTWNPTTGAFSVTTLLDTNGDAGLSGLNGVSGVTIAVVGGSATATIPGENPSVANRVTGSSAIVGAWFLGDATVADNSFLVVFLPNGVYFMAVDQPPGSDNGPDGIEHGTYAWDPVSGAITSSRSPAPYIDTNGSWGLSDPNAPLIMHVSADGLILTIIEGVDQYTAPRIGAANSQVFQINAGLNDAWYNSDTGGQGFFVTVFPGIGQIFLAWFTYEVERPDEAITAQLGEPGHRWVTAFGPYADNQSALDVEITQGGVFDSGTPTPTQHPDGTVILEFSDCYAGTATYDIPSINRQGVIPIRRISNDNVALCETLAAQAGQQTR